ncbi:MAG: response regulator [Proteobacteria bacterium]|nr:response regulator [Pseudomonadota bacterium]
MGGQTVEVGARRLLIVDDDTEVCAVIGDIAEEQGYEVTTTHSGAEFMARYLESHPHRIVLDLALPDHDGMELLKFLADRKCAADIILISSHGELMLDQAMKLGGIHGLNMRRMLPKPFSLDDLKAALA